MTARLLVTGVDEEAVQPCVEGTGVAQTPDLTPSLHQRVLNGIFRGDLRYADQFGDGITDAYYDAVRVATQADLQRLAGSHRSVFGHQLGAGVLVPRGAALNERGFPAVDVKGTR